MAGEIADDVLGPLRAICAALPDAYEENAWTGIRWRVRKRTFAHVFMVEPDWPPAYARAARTTEPITVLTFRSEGAELEVLTNSGPPFFKPPWGPSVVGLDLDRSTDWEEVGELLTESYCLLAPKKLVDLVNRPDL